MEEGPRDFWKGVWQQVVAAGIIGGWSMFWIVVVPQMGSSGIGLPLV
jgi:hypothetical protein